MLVWNYSGPVLHYLIYNVMLHYAISCYNMFCYVYLYIYITLYEVGLLLQVSHRETQIYTQQFSFQNQPPSGKNSFINSMDSSHNLRP